MSKQVQVILRLPEETAVAISQHADRLGVPRARVLRRAVEEYLRAHKHDTSPPRRRKNEQRKLTNLAER